MRSLAADNWSLRWTPSERAEATQSDRPTPANSSKISSQKAALRRCQMVTVFMSCWSQGLGEMPQGSTQAGTPREKWQGRAGIRPLPHRTVRPGSTAGFGISAMSIIYSLLCDPDNNPVGPRKTRMKCRPLGWASGQLNMHRRRRPPSVALEEIPWMALDVGVVHRTLYGDATVSLGRSSVGLQVF